VREAYEQRRDTLVRALAAEPPGLIVPSPAGGWFLWLPLPDGMTASTLLPVAGRHGVSFVPGTEFYLNGDEGEHFIRLCFSFLTLQELAEAAGRLTAAMRTIRA
jgi:2-aminoadipate transaminase